MKRMALVKENPTKRPRFPPIPLINDDAVKSLVVVQTLTSVVA